MAFRNIGPPILPWDNWQERAQTVIVVSLLILFGGGYLFYQTFNTPVSRRNSTCKMESWIIIYPQGHGGGEALDLDYLFEVADFRATIRAEIYLTTENPRAIFFRNRNILAPDRRARQ